MRLQKVRAAKKSEGFIPAFKVAEYENSLLLSVWNES